MLYNRITKSYIKDVEQGESKLNFLYNTIIGRVLLKIVVNPFISVLYGLYNNSFVSKYKINKFIKKSSIDVSRFEEKDYTSFNDFFTRKLKNISIDLDKNSFISPCDSKLLVYDIKDNIKFRVKGVEYSIKELLNEDIDNIELSKCLVFRLSLDDYHRYCFVDDGFLVCKKDIKGKLHTVRPISNDSKVYKINKRSWSLLSTENFGLIYQIEVGALFVGDICNKRCLKFLKGEEKGYFNIGGSTIVLLVGNNVRIDDDIIEQSKLGIETIVRYGEKIGSCEDDLKC